MTIHAGALLLLWSLKMSGIPAAALAAALSISLYTSVRRHGLRKGPQAIRSFSLDEEDNCAIHRRGDDEGRPCVITRQFVQPWVTILMLRITGHRTSEALVLARDALDPDSFRKLRARLRLRNPAV